MARNGALDPQSLLEAIAAARDHAAPGAEALLTFERRYDPAYWLDQAPEPEWMPRDAEINVVVSGGAASWRELEISIASGPRDMYRYFPFVCYVYVDGRAASVVEFAEEEQERSAVVSVPVGKPCTVRVISELSCAPTTQEERELAIVLRGLRIGKATRAPHTGEPQDVSAFSHNAVPLVVADPRPAFVVGPYRSGTSILTWALGQHPNIWPLDETRWLQLLGSGALAAYAVATNATTNYFDTYGVSKEEYMAHLGSAVDQFMVTRQANGAHRSRHSSGFRAWLRASIGASGAPERLWSEERWVDGRPRMPSVFSCCTNSFPLRGSFVSCANPTT